MQPNNINQEDSKIINQEKAPGKLPVSLGWLFFGCGIIFLIIFQFIQPEHPKNGETWKDLSEYFISFAGILLSASSIIFFYYALRQQTHAIKQQQISINMQSEELKLQREELKLQREDLRLQTEEMKEANNNFLSQKRETLFFNLLSNHEKVASNYGIEKINNEYNYCKTSLLTYHKSLNYRVFQDCLQTTHNPQRLLGEHKSFNMLIKNALHIYHYIEKHLEDKEFYHQTLFNSLNEGEKFIFGMAIENNLITPNIENFTDIYKKHFWESSPYHNFHKSGVFPVIDCELYVNSREEILKANFLKALPFIFDLKTFVRRTYLGRKINFVGYDFYLKSFGKKSRGVTKINIPDFYEAQPVGLEIDLHSNYSYLFNYMLEELEKSSFQANTYRCTLILHFQFQIYDTEKLYPIQIYQEFDLNYNKSSSSDSFYFYINKVVNPQFVEQKDL